MNPDIGGPRAPERRIIGFDTDEHGDWIALLECGHGQHVRHDPPWQVREWTTTEERRNAMLGSLLCCAKCTPQDSE